MTTAKFQVEQDLSKEIQGFTVDTSFLDFFNKKKMGLTPQSIPSNLESEIRKRINGNFKNLQEMGDSICLKIKNEVEDVLKEEKEVEKVIRKNLIMKMKEFLLFFKSLNIPACKISEFPVSPYYHPKAQLFIELAKFGRTEKMKVLIEKENNETFVYEYDHLLLTGLHWAVKRNHTRAAEFLIQSNSFVNALDIFGRPPLYYAIINKNVYIVYQLLIRNANPWSCRGENYLKISDNSSEILFYLKKFRRFQIALALVHYKERENVRKEWKSKLQAPKMPLN